MKTIRAINDSAGLAVEYRSNEDKVSNHLTGNTVVFNRSSSPMRIMTGKGMVEFREIVEPTAFGDTDMSDVLCAFNHDHNVILGRSRNNVGTLQLEIRGDGLYFNVALPDTEKARDVMSMVQRGDVYGCSYMYHIDTKKDEEWESRDGVVYRYVRRVRKLIDVGPVVVPAYPDTTVSPLSRSYEEWQEEKTTKLPDYQLIIDSYVARNKNFERRLVTF